MNWDDAMKAMRAGNRVQRHSERTRVLIDDNEGVPVYQSGEEPCYLADAWTYDERPVKVFCGADSGVLFVPGSDHRSATDWVIV